MSQFGHNLGYIDELYKRYVADPESVSEAWQDFFRDYRPEPARAPVQGPAPAEPVPAKPEAQAETDPGRPLSGAAARIVDNMEASLAVPTATSARAIPVKMLEENRRVMNAHQSTVSGPRISFTHLLAWAIVRALERHPAMCATYVERDGRPFVIPCETLNLGLAIDVERRGERLLLVPNIRDATRLGFLEFVAAYDDLVARARIGRLTVDDFQSTTVTLTNPGMLGTALSVPRLMQGQGAILGIGTIGYPAEYAGTDPQLISELGLSKTMTVTSTYDHRVIQGAESGAFLKTLERLLQGEEAFYDRLFGDLGVPQEPLRFAGDQHPQILGTGRDYEVIAKQAGVLQLIRAFRVRGHLWADLDPLHYAPQANPELELATYGLSVWDLDRRFIVGGLGGHKGTRKLREILDILQRTYCWHSAAEFMHIPDTACRQWLQERLEREPEPLTRETKTAILKRLNVAEAFEKFLHTNYVGQKRFSLEGAETLIPMLDALLDDAGESGVEQIVMGMAHRGRLNVLAHVVGKSYGEIFLEFEGIDPSSTHGSGDVKYHLGARGNYRTRAGRELAIVLASNPSHLEAVDPVVQGMARARQDLAGDTERERVLPVLLHGDASFAGQGVVAETLHASLLSGYRTGGTVHVIVNNQIGFTTGPADARSSTYATDVAKMVGSPIFHVNGDHPESAVRMMRLALAFRQVFNRDVVIDLVCYRRWGHNEADDPSYTHPILYERIRNHRSVRKLYTEQLVRRGDLDAEQAERALEHFQTRLREVHDEVNGAKRTAPQPAIREELPELADDVTVSTEVERSGLEQVLEALVRTPEGFAVHPKLVRQLQARRERFEKDRLDWALAEALAFGSLAQQGTPVRLSGEDSGRGTFSQRHAVLYDHTNGERWVPLANIAPDQAPFHVHDSLLSEFAVLGFEYGYSVDHPAALVMWEAQFGDFVNGAQVIIDQFITSAEAKWGQTSGLVLLLPHGYEGQGPEHSSARPERFLQLAAERNIRVVYPSTPAQYFHLLRRQVLRSERKPLVTLTPKSLLRLPECVSSVDDLTQGAFRATLDDPRRGELTKVRRLLLCSGKVYYDLCSRRAADELSDVAVLRLEQLYPFPAASLASLLQTYAEVAEIGWVQEEPRNMGAWAFVERPIRELLGPDRDLLCFARSRSSSPATGSSRRHALQQERLIEDALVGSPREAPLASAKRSAG